MVSKRTSHTTKVQQIWTSRRSVRAKTIKLNTQQSWVNLVTDSLQYRFWHKSIVFSLYLLVVLYVDLDIKNGKIIIIKKNNKTLKLALKLTLIIRLYVFAKVLLQGGDVQACPHQHSRVNYSARDINDKAEHHNWTLGNSLEIESLYKLTFGSKCCSFTLCCELIDCWIYSICSTKN